MDTIYQFTSASKPGLSAFTGDRAASSLPEKYGPWNLVAEIESYKRLPFELPRKDVEAGITERGYQLWRMRGTTKG